MRSILMVENLIADLKDSEDIVTGGIVTSARLGLDNSYFNTTIRNIGSNQFSTNVFNTWMFLQLSLILSCRKILRLSWEFTEPDFTTVIDVDEFFNKIMELQN